mmetsp:Transcript_9526/g.22429  ORF Transcript_9526/g.22429 Transcript_9526/m.22429 type:complete len:130 (-) Transcript_9526:329-718(-)
MASIAARVGNRRAARAAVNVANVANPNPPGQAQAPPQPQVPNNLGGRIAGQVGQAMRARQAAQRAGRGGRGRGRGLVVDEDVVLDAVWEAEALLQLVVAKSQLLKVHQQPRPTSNRTHPMLPLLMQVAT